ncbi:50S ribosomal protein L21 [Patescibacteria group bacterium]|nr:50S ribosomal protein L21 [Patescibacteria group bacterium]
MKYAVIQIAGKQYRVEAGQELTINQVDAEEGKNITVSDVLLTVDGDNVSVGAPLVKGATVTLKVKSHGRGDKIRVAKYKAKSRYRKVFGHRQQETTVEVVSIG